MVTVACVIASRQVSLKINEVRSLCLQVAALFVYFSIDWFIDLLVYSTMHKFGVGILFCLCFQKKSLTD